MRTNPWIKIGFDAWWLAVEASSVIGLRALKLAAGGASAAAESRRMVSEKIAAGLTLAGKLGVSRPGPRATAKTLSHYRRRVRANRKRLSKS
jgi:hypothetical protein